MVCEPLTANALEPDHETWLLRRAIAARRRHSASMRPAPITADKHRSLRFAYAVGNPTLYRPGPTKKSDGCTSLIFHYVRVLRLELDCCSRRERAGAAIEFRGRGMPWTGARVRLRGCRYGLY